jgi:hypothetical protein
MRAWHLIRTVAICYALLCIILAVFLGELAFHPQKMPLRERQSAKVVGQRGPPIARLNLK